MNSGPRLFRVDTYEFIENYFTTLQFSLLYTFFVVRGPASQQCSNLIFSGSAHTDISSLHFSSLSQLKNKFFKVCTYKN